MRGGGRTGERERKNKGESERQTCRTHSSRFCRQRNGVSAVEESAHPWGEGERKRASAIESESERLTDSETALVW